MGALPSRASMGDGARGLLGRWRRLGLLPFRASRFSSLPLGRGRHGRHLRRRPAHLHGSSALERPRPHFERAALRAHERSRQPRRGRQGMLVAPGRHSHFLMVAMAVPLPQSRFPYEELVAENARRSRLGPEYELVDTGVFADGRYFVVTVTWAKASPEDILWLIEATNMGRGTAYLDLLPTVWFRNRWSWQPGTSKPCVAAVPSGNPGNSASPHDGTGTAACLSISEERRGRFELVGGFGVCGQSGTPVRPELLFTDNETNSAKLWGTEGPRYTKDAIAEHVLNGPGPVNPALSGTKAALRYHFEVPPGMTASVRLRFGRQSGDLGAGFDAVLAARKAEADEFYARLAPAGASPEEARVLRQAAAGMLWCKQFYHYDVKRWLDGDPGQPPPPPQRREGRNSRWLHLFNHEVISMPDSWEYPWYAAWDLAFHAVALAYLDPEYAKYQ